jgi:uncharacterized protein
MMTAQFPLDLQEELERLLPSYELCVPSIVINELEKIKKKVKGKNKASAAIALKIASSPPFKVKPIHLYERESVDDALIRVSKVLCTNDRELRRKAREKGITVVYLRQKRYLAVDGYLNV